MMPKSYYSNYTFFNLYEGGYCDPFNRKVRENPDCLAHRKPARQKILLIFYPETSPIISLIFFLLFLLSLPPPESVPFLYLNPVLKIHQYHDDFHSSAERLAIAKKQVLFSKSLGFAG